MLHLQRALLAVIDRGQHPGAQQLGQLARVDRVALVARLQQRVLARVAHHKSGHAPRQQIEQPGRMRSLFEGHVKCPAHPTDKIQNRRRPRGQNRLLDQTAALIQHRRGNRVPVDIKPDISHTVHLGVPLFWLWLTASAQQPQLTRKGRPFIMRGPDLNPGAFSRQRKSRYSKLTHAVRPQTGVPTNFVRGVVRRFQREGDDHFITLSCSRREPCLPLNLSNRK